MRLVTYLAGEYPGGKEEAQSEFGKRAGIGQATVSRVLAGCGCTMGTAMKIVEATGGLVTLEDLAPTPEAEPEAEGGARAAG